MKNHILFLFCLLALILAACAPAPTPVPTPVPSNTPSPTLTPTSTPTLPPTATPTATPNATATQAAKATQQAQAVAAQVKSDLETLGVPVDTGSLVYYQSDPQTIELSQHNQALFDKLVGAEALKAGNFALSTDITWKSPGLSTCGIIFRSGSDLKNGAQYVFQILRLSGLPAWDIEYFEDNQWQNSPVRPKTSSALNQGSGDTNHIVLLAEDGKFTIYINGVRQGSYYDYSEQSLEGIFGVIAWQDTGSSSCTYENTSVWAYE